MALTEKFDHTGATVVTYVTGYVVLVPVDRYQLFIKCFVDNCKAKLENCEMLRTKRCCQEKSFMNQLLGAVFDGPNGLTTINYVQHP